MGAATLAYTVREVYGAVAYGYDFLPTSISFRMGIGFIIAEVAGAMSTRLVRDRDRIGLLHNTSRYLAASLGVARVLEAVAKSACDALAGVRARIRGERRALQQRLIEFSAPTGCFPCIR